jgi:solute carrier family 25 S-adenosylmethionine transporter 26
MLTSLNLRPFPLHADAQVSAVRAVYANGGGKAFFRGIGPRALSNGINSAVFFCFFEALRGQFARQVRPEGVGLPICIACISFKIYILTWLLNTMTG